MIVAAVFQFYFDHFLPVDDSWPAGFTFDIGHGRVNIEPRLAGAPLYPEDIDRTLSTAELRLVPLGRPGEELELRIRDRIVDRIQATVIRENVEVVDGQLPDGLEQEMTDEAIEAIDVVVSHCRVLTDALFLDGVRREYRPDDGRSYVLNPHTITWAGGDDPEHLPPLPIYPGGVNATALSGAIRAPERGAVEFERLNESINTHGSAPPLPLSLLATAQERVAQLFLREAIVAAATALEVASEQYLERTGRGGDQDVRAILDDRNLSFAERRYEQVPELISGRSLCAESQDEFEDVQRLYRARNSAAHAGELSYREDGVDVTVDQAKALDLVLAAHVAVEWLDAL